MQGVEQNKVRLFYHDESWEEEFFEVKAQLFNIWTDNVVEIQHFGSTAIKGICAKPILDVAVVIRSFSSMDKAAMERVGYEGCGMQTPDNKRYLFVLRKENEVEGRLPVSLRHIHVYEPGNPDYFRCIGFRDYLISHPETAAMYSSLKLRLAEQNPDDRDTYTRAKTNFIQCVCSQLPDKKS